MNADQKREAVARVAAWFHSYDFGDGVRVSGHKSLDKLDREWRLLEVPDLTGKTVLDINTWDGWFALQAERHGARRVVALDSYMWSMDLAEHSRYCQEIKAVGGIPKPYHELPYFRPDELPGKVGFDTARRIFGSGVEEVVGDFVTMNLDPLRCRFDVVLYLGTLYHMADPIGNLRRLYEVTAPGGLAVIETQAMTIDGLEHVPLCENFGPLHSLNTDSSNWWSPNALALRQMLLAVGFESADILVGPPPPVVAPRNPAPLVRPYRAYAHARRSTAASDRVNPVPFM
ncbi:MAG: methyltransferase domain-containing protein [Planctomycetota bacterium]